MKKITLSAAAIVTTSILVAAGASAHVSANPAVGVANVSQEITLQIGHGCGIPNVVPETNTDTSSLTVDIPAGVTSVRAVSSTDFPSLTVTKNGSGAVTSITWAKVPGTELAADTNFYKLTLRAKLPNLPFTKVYFKAHQVCKAPGKTAEWIGTPTENVGEEPAAEVAIDEAQVVPIDRLRRARLPKSKLGADSAYAASAEALHSRLRVFFSRSGPLRFLGHLDFLKNLPRLLRRAGIEVAYSRGFNPVPRLSLGPALALGIASDEDAFDVDVILPESARDMTGELGDDERTQLAAELLARLRGVMPEGLVTLETKLLRLDEPRLGQMIGAADFAVRLDPDAMDGLPERLATTMAFAELPMVRKKIDRRRSATSQGTPGVTIDVRKHLVSAELDAATSELRFRLRMEPTGTARPREVVLALLGIEAGEHVMRRVRLLARDGDGFATLR